MLHMLNPEPQVTQLLGSKLGACQYPLPFGDFYGKSSFRFYCDEQEDTKAYMNNLLAALQQEASKTWGSSRNLGRGVFSGVHRLSAARWKEVP